MNKVSSMILFCLINLSFQKGHISTINVESNGKHYVLTKENMNEQIALISQSYDEHYDGEI